MRWGVSCPPASRPLFGRGPAAEQGDFQGDSSSTKESPGARPPAEDGPKRTAAEAGPRPRARPTVRPLPCPPRVCEFPGLFPSHSRLCGLRSGMVTKLRVMQKALPWLWGKGPHANIGKPYATKRKRAPHPAPKGGRAGTRDGGAGSPRCRSQTPQGNG